MRYVRAILIGTAIGLAYRVSPLAAWIVAGWLILVQCLVIVWRERSQ